MDDEKAPNNNNSNINNSSIQAIKPSNMSTAIETKVNFLPNDTLAMLERVSSGSFGNDSSRPSGNENSMPNATNIGQLNGSNKESNSNNNSNSSNNNNLNVNNILTEADNAATAAQTMTLGPPGAAPENSLTNLNNMNGGNSNLIFSLPQDSIVAMDNNSSLNNTNGLVLSNNMFHKNTVPDLLLGASGAAANNVFGTNPFYALNTINAANLNPYLLANAIAPTTIPVSETTPAANLIDTSPASLLQQNQAIMQQNAAALQHLQQTNNFLAANPGAAATLGILAPMMNMNPANLAAATGMAANPGQPLFAAAAAAATTTPVLNNVGSAAPGGGLMSPALILGAAQQPGVNPSSSSSGLGASPSALPTLPQIMATQQQQQQSPVLQQFQGPTNIAPTNNTNDSVSNILRTAFMLQNGNLPLLQQQLVPTTTNNTNGGYNTMVRPNNNSPPVPAPSLINYVHDNNTDGSSSVDPNGGAAAAAANAVASVLPTAASVNALLWQQQLQNSLSFPVGVDHLRNNNNSNNLQAPAVSSSNLGVGTSQQQLQQQYIPTASLQPTSAPSVQHPPSLAVPPATNGLNSSSDNSSLQRQQQQQSETSQERRDVSKEKGQCRPLFLDHDSNCLTSYQCFLRKQIELFEVDHDELRGTAQGRNTPLQYGQVGIRCRHCAHLTKAARPRGGVYYSRTIDGVYQVAQNMSKLHFMKACTMIPENTKNQLMSLQSVSSRASGGKEYWAEALRVLGVVEEGGVLRFSSSLQSHLPTKISTPPAPPTPKPPNG